jgi:hypothetical protein
VCVQRNKIKQFKNKIKMKNLIGKQVIVRADKAGVFYGTLTAKEGSEVQLTNARKLYYWSGANTVEDLAATGVNAPDSCKFTIIVTEIVINNYLQILPCTKKAIKSIESVSIWKN